MHFAIQRGLDMVWLASHDNKTQQHSDTQVLSFRREANLKSHGSVC